MNVQDAHYSKMRVLSSDLADRVFRLPDRPQALSLRVATEAYWVVGQSKDVR